jgi:hypothetical protein
MSATKVDDLLEEILALPDEARTELIHALIASQAEDAGVYPPEQS